MSSSFYTQNANDTLVTESLLLQLTDCDTLEEIRVISLRNKELTSCLRILANCQNLTIGYLQGNIINLQDMMYLQMFSSLRKLDLSSNQITALPGPQVFAGLQNLKFLYLHDNRISSWNDIQSLTSLKSVFHITVFSNPVCQIPGYRHFLVNSIQSLLALDNYVITDEERIEDASFGYRFRALNEYMKLHVPDYAKEKSAEQHLFNLEVDVYRLKRIFERNSPSILIQSLYRGYRSRNYVKVYFNERKQKIIKIQKVTRGWLMRKKFKKDLKDMLVYTGQEYLMLTNTEIRQRNAARRIKNFMIKRYREKKRKTLHLRSALTIQRLYRGRFVKNTSFINALELGKSPRIYFLKEQKSIFVRILKQLIPLYEQKNQMKFEQIVACIHEDSRFDTIRVAEPDLFEFKAIPLIQFTKPSLISRVRYSKQPKAFDNSFGLQSLLFSDLLSRRINQQRWQILQKRNCRYRKEKVLQAIERNKKKTVKNQYLFQDQYKDLLVFEPPHLDMIITFCFAVLDRNKKAANEGDQQFLLFFESLLSKVSAASTIQQAWRAQRFRKGLVKLPIQRIIEKRAAYAIQRWWSNTKLKKRMRALTNIKRHIDKVMSSEIFIEQTLYSNIQQIVSTIHSQMRFDEQNLNFDFNGTNYQIQMQQQEKDKVVLRYANQAVPRWFSLGFKSAEFKQSDKWNNLLGLFHFNDANCQILPANHVINYEKNQLDIDRNLYFVSVKCASIDEARRRSVVIALLTYDIHSNLFLQMQTAEMLQDPFMVQSIYKLKKRFNLDYLSQTKHREVDVKTRFCDQSRQLHNSIIISEKDLKYLRFNTQMKQIKLETTNRSVAISYRNKAELDVLENEVADREIRNNMLKDGAQEVSFYDTKKLHKEAFAVIKAKRDQLIKESVQEFKDLKLGQKTLFQEQAERILEDRREEVNKVRFISKIINTEQKNELQKNLAVFLTLNKEEKLLRRELVEKQMEVDFKEKYLKKMNVVQMHKQRQIKKEEQEKFINSFHQAKNLIEKQMKIGKRIKEQSQQRKSNQDKVKNFRLAKMDMGPEKLAIKSVLYDDKLLNLSNEMSRAQAHALDYGKSSRKGGTTQGGQGQTGPTMADESYQSQSRLFTKSAEKVTQHKSYYLPPLHDQSFHDNTYNSQRQYTGWQDNHYATNQTNQTFNSVSGIMNQQDMELNRDIEQIYKTTVQNRANFKKTHTRPIFAEESYPLMKVNSLNESYDMILNGNSQQSEIKLKSVLKNNNQSFVGPIGNRNFQGNQPQMRKNYNSILN